MATTVTPLTNTAWVDLGATPMNVFSNSDRDSAILVVADAAPTSLTADGLRLSTRNTDGLPIYGTGQHVWARALNHQTSVIVLPYAPVGGGSGGGTANPYPGSDYATAGKQDTGNTSAAATAAAIGTTADAATASGANTTQIGALRAIRDRLLGTLNTALVAGSAIVGKFGIDQTTPGTTNGVVVNSCALPTGAATAAGQQGAAVFSEQTNAALAANATSTGTARDGGATPLFCKFNAVVSSTQAGTLFIQGSNDNFTTVVGVGSVAVSANVPAYLVVPVMFRYYRYVFANGATAATVFINTSYTAA